MVIIRNVFSNIRCSKGRNILIGIIVLVIAASSCVALSVKQAAKRAEEDGLKNLSITASISFDREKLMQSAQSGEEDFRQRMQGIENLSLDEMRTYAESSYVDDFYYTASASINGNDSLEPVSSESGAESGETQRGMPGGDMKGFSFAQGDFTIIGYSAYAAMTDFVSGSSKITQGEIFDAASEEYQCVISEELAAYNGLDVGDAITLVNPNDAEQSFSFTITGLYTYTSADDSGFNMRFSTAMDPANQIYTSCSALNKAIAYTQENASASTNEDGMEQSTALVASTGGTYVFTDIDHYNGFTEDVRAMGLSDDYTVASTDLSSYENSLLPIKNTAKFADMMLWIILGVGGLVLIALNIFNVRERKYEVGVLTAIGMKKSKVALQFVTELFVITFCAIIIGSAAGAAASVPVSNSLLESQITQQEAQTQQQSGNFGRPGQQMPGIGGQFELPGQSRQDDYITTLNAAADIIVILKLLGIGLLLTCAASLGAVVIVMRYEPLKILSERT